MLALVAAATIWTPQAARSQTRLVEVPRVIGTDSATARRILERGERLEVAPFIPVFSRDFVAGTVSDQRPAGGDSVRQGTRVQVWVSRGPEPDTTLVIVPHVLDLDVERARAEILASRLALGTVRTRPGTDGGGPVVEQHPAPGDTARVGDAVGLLLTGAPLVTPVPPVVQPGRPDSVPAAPPVVVVTGDAVLMPAVTDSTVARALSMLNAIGLRAPVVDPRAAITNATDWIVASQLPLAGEPLRPTTQVRLSAIVTSAVPKLVGLSERDAESAAAASAFGMRIERRTRVLRLFGSRVVTQNPAPLTRVAVLAPIVVRVEDPLPLMASLGAGIVLLATAAGARAAPPRPRLRASLASDLPDVRCDEDALVETEFALHVEVDADPSSLEFSGGSLILEEEVHA